MNKPRMHKGKPPCLRKVITKGTLQAAGRNPHGGNRDAYPYRYASGYVTVPVNCQLLTVHFILHLRQQKGLFP